MMTEQLERTLIPVRSRQRAAAMLHMVIAGLLISAAAALVLEALRRWQGWWYTPAPGLLLLLAGPVVGAIIGSIHKHPFSAAAAAIDKHYSLKDRTATALAFEHDTDPSPLESLAIADAEAHLAGIDPKQVAPLRMPGRWWQAAALFLLAIVIVLWPGRAPVADAHIPLGPIPGIIAEAEEIEEDIHRLEELAKEQNNPEAQALADKLREAAEAMKQPGVDVKEALAKLSEMQAMLVQQQAEFNLAMTDAQLADAGVAMTLAEMLKDAGEALKNEKFEEAADELDQLEELPRNPAAEQRLRKTAEKMKKSGLSDLGDATSQLAVAMGGGGGDGKGGKRLSKLVRRHNQRRSLSRWMMREMAKLSESKSNCLSCNTGQCKQCNGGGCASCGGTGFSAGLSLSRSNNTSQSNQPSQQWGTGSSGNPTGDPTKLDGTRQLQQITGAMGEGESETETMHSPEARQLAGREYRDAYQQYQKLSESVLEREPIPLGHRQTIRRYFESIRPTDSGEE